MNDKSSRCADSGTIRPSLRRARSHRRPVECAFCRCLCLCLCFASTSRVDTPQARPRLAATDECMRKHQERIGRAVQLQPPRPHVECIIRPVELPSARFKAGREVSGRPIGTLIRPHHTVLFWDHQSSSPSTEHRMDRYKSKTRPAAPPRRTHPPSSP